MFPKSFSSSALALVVAAVFIPSAAYATGENIGDTQRCVHLNRTKSTSVVDDSTILITMRGRDSYKRVDLRSPCSGIEHSGFGVSMQNDRLCTSNTLVVMQTGGASCMIEKIVTIDEAEAAALRAQ